VWANVQYKTLKSSQACTIDNLSQLLSWRLKTPSKDKLAVVRHLLVPSVPSRCQSPWQQNVWAGISCRTGRTDE